MSGSQAFMSFVNYMKTALEPHGVEVYVGKVSRKQEPPPPYIVLKYANDSVESWNCTVFVHCWVVAGEKESEPLEVTSLKFIELLTRLLQGVGMLAKYDYTQNPATQTGGYLARMSGGFKDRTSEKEANLKVYLLNIHLDTTISGEALPSLD